MFTQNIRKIRETLEMYLLLVQNIDNILSKIFENNEILLQIIRKLSKFCSKHYKSIWFWPKTLKKYWISVEQNVQKVSYLVMNIRKESNFYPKHLKSIWFCPQIIRNVSKFDPTCLESVFFWLKSFKKFRICTRKRWKEYVLDPKHSESISFRPKIFEKFLKLLQDVREVSNFIQTKQEVSYLYTKPT